jgi:hypothetical protein
MASTITLVAAIWGPLWRTSAEPFWPRFQVWDVASQSQLAEENPKLKSRWLAAAAPVPVAGAPAAR